MGLTGWLLVIVIALAISIFALWRAALAFGNADTLNRIDALYSRDLPVGLAAAERYGETEAQRLELYVPQTDADGPHKVIIFVHGGSWSFGAPEEYRFLARTFGDLGYATALAGYRLVPGGEFPAMLQDTAASVRWVVDNAAKFNLDAGNIYLMGHSAGAYNVLMTGLDRQWLQREGLSGSAIKGVISLAGPADFYPFDSDSTKAAFGQVDAPELTQPVTFARGDAPPLLLMHGLEDTTVYPKNSQNLHRLVTQAGGTSYLEEYAGIDHAQIMMRLSRPFQENRALINRVDQFIKDTSAARASAAVQAESP